MLFLPMRRETTEFLMVSAFQPVAKLHHADARIGFTQVRGGGVEAALDPSVPGSEVA